MLLAAALVIIPGAIHCGAIQASAQSPKGVMKVAIHLSINAEWFDPSITFPTITGFLPLYLFHDALLKPMPGTLHAPCLAESWTVSQDHKTYEFKLRRDVKFHNGDPLTADDVVFSFQRYKGGAAKVIQSKIEKLEAVNPYLFRVRFKEPFLDFLDYLLPGPGGSTIGWIVPKKYIEKVGDAEYKRHPVGCGPYKFVRFENGLNLVGEAFDGFWRKTPKIKRLEFQTIPEISTRYSMVKRGEVDLALAMVDLYYARVKKDSDLRMVTALSPNGWFIYMASQWDPKSPWSDPRVRQAASLAIDRKTMADIIFPEGGAAGSFGLEGDPDTVVFPPEPYDTEQAKKLLAQAGYPRGLEGGKFYLYGGAMGTIGEMVGNYWKAVGINTDIISPDSSSFLAQRMGGKLKDAVFTEVVGAPTIALRFSFWFGPQSYGNYQDLQAMWAEYNNSLDPKVWRDLIQRIQRVMHDKTMLIPLIKATVPSAAGPRVKGDPFKIREPFPIWVPTPLEDLELSE